ncbi:MAG: ATP-grasp domain-containing protein [Minisyncoccia bacterium]
MNTIPKRTGCSACGTSIVHHQLTHFLNIIDEVLDKTAKPLFSYIPLPNEAFLADRIFGILTAGLHFIGLVRFNTDRSKVRSGRSELIWNEAVRRGIPMEQIMVCGKYLEQYRARLNDRWFYFVSIPIPPWMPQADYAWVDDKLKLAHRLKAANIPVPQAILASSWEAALRAFGELKKPIIIKPRFGSRSRHTTTNINTQEELRVAFTLAKQVARELVLEEHIFGSVCRATLVNGKLAGFFRANPPQIIGDGTQTIVALIAEKNKNRSERIGPIEITDDVTTFISRHGHSLESILPQGALLDLSAKTGRFYGGYTKEMLPEIHPKMRTIFEKVAAMIDAPVLGFDLISTDPTADPDTMRWGIIECNGLPFIDLHYYALEGEPNDISPHIWNLWSTTPSA